MDILVDKSYTNFKSKISRALQVGDIISVKQLKASCPDNLCTFILTETGDTVLHVASRLGHADIVNFLLAEHPNAVNIENRDSKTPLHEAAQFTKYDVIKTLLDYNANVNVLKRSDWTPLMLACTKTRVMNENYRCVELLLQQGAFVNYVNKDGWSALHLICREGCTAILKLLKGYGADVFKTTKNGRSSLHIAALHKNLEIVEALVNFHLDVNLKDNCGNTALHEAVLGGSIDIFNYLLCKGANINAVNNLGFGMLHLCASIGNMDFITYLVNSNLEVDINAKNNLHFTPMHCAARNGHRATVQLLEKFGGDGGIEDAFGRSAIVYL